MGTMTMQDVADLASVSRQAVSMWRKRPVVRGVPMPFPAPREVIDGVEHFDHADIVEWLAKTGRGNKPSADADLDAPAVAVPDSLTLEDAVTLLCWHAVTLRSLVDTSAQERLSLAQRSDPDDSFMLRELRALRPTRAALAYIDALVDASFGPGDALNRLENGRLHRRRHDRGLTDEALAILGSIVDAAVTYLGTDDVVICGRGDPTPALAVSERVGRLAVGESDADRAAFRRAWIRGIGIADDSPRPEVIVVSVIGMDDHAALDLADLVTMDLAPDDVAVVIGRAGLLVDRLADKALRDKRNATLRVGNAVAALRLPRGLWREAHRQNLGAWLCRGHVDRERVAVGDLERINDSELRDLHDDIAGALAGSGRRAYRFLHPLPAGQVRGAGAVVPRGVTPVRVRHTDARDYLGRVHAASLVTTRPVAILDVLTTESIVGIQFPRRSLGELADQEKIEVLRRSRISAEHASSAGTVRVLPEDEFRLDPLDAQRHYPAARRTRPGDVVFVEQPQPRAWVDTEGGALVAHPAYILRRLAPTTEERALNELYAGPYLIAAVINRCVGAAREWRMWNVPVLAPKEAAQLDAELARIVEYERELDRRRTAAADLAVALIDGIADGAVSLNVEEGT